jgi:hypothetical protein
MSTFALEQSNGAKQLTTPPRKLEAPSNVMRRNIGAVIRGKIPPSMFLPVTRVLVV